MDARVGIEPTIKLLQSLALPLGYPAPCYLISFIWVAVILII